MLYVWNNRVNLSRFDTPNLKYFRTLNSRCSILFRTHYTVTPKNLIKPIEFPVSKITVKKTEKYEKITAHLFQCDII